MDNYDMAVLVIFICILLYTRLPGENIENMTEPTPDAEREDLPKKEEEQTPQFVLKPQIVEENKKMLNDILHEKNYTADDKIFNASIVSGFKDRIAKENRSHWNNDNWKKYYDYELGVHEQSNRDWWTNDDYELRKAGHVVI